MQKLPLALIITGTLLLQGCQSTMNNAVESVKTSWDEAKQRNAERKAKWYYNNKPLMAPKFKNGKDFNVNAKKDTIDGFRDYKWSSELLPEMVLVKTDGLLSFYRSNKLSTNTIGGATLSDVQFVYFDGRLHSVKLITDNETDGQALLSALDVTFGVGLAPDFPSAKPWNATYSLTGSPLFVHSNIFHYNKHYGWGEYDCFEDNKPCIATLTGKIEEYKYQEAFASQANAAASDF